MTNNEAMALLRALQKTIKTEETRKTMSNLAAYRFHRLIGVLSEELDKVQKNLNAAAESLNNSDVPKEDLVARHNELLDKVGGETFAVTELPKLPGAGVPWYLLDHDEGQIILRFAPPDGEPVP